MKIICTICARGGSKGVVDKNIRRLDGKPLIAHTIEQAKESDLFDYIAVSSDSKKILDIAEDYSVDFCIERPSELSSDKAAKIPVIRHCVNEVEKRSGHKFDICVDLDCTSPLRKIADIKGALALLKESDCENVITGMVSRRSPYFNLVEENADGIVSLSKKMDTPINRRQDVPKTYDMNASIYIWKRDTLQNNDTLFLPSTKIFEMPEERSIDIDSEQDFDYVSFIMRKRNELRK